MCPNVGIKFNRECNIEQYKGAKWLKHCNNASKQKESAFESNE